MLHSNVCLCFIEVLGNFMKRSATLAVLRDITIYLHDMRFHLLKHCVDGNIIPPKNKRERKNKQFPYNEHNLFSFFSTFFVYITCYYIWPP